MRKFNPSSGLACALGGGAAAALDGAELAIACTVEGGRVEMLRGVGMRGEVVAVGAAEAMAIGGGGAVVGAIGGLVAKRTGGAGSAAERGTGGGAGALGASMNRR